ncbi:MAG: phage baseplate protein [Kofleriaceae bacterium]
MAEIPTGAFTPAGQFAMIEFADGSARFLIDVTLSEDHTFESDVTKFPTESGGTFTDHIRKEPITITIEGLVTNTPLDAMRTIRQQESPAAAQFAYAFLLAVWNRDEPVTVRSSLGTFRQMALTSLTVPRSREVGDALKFTARFQQIETKSNARVAVKRTATRGSGGKNKQGSKGPEYRERGPVLWRKGVLPTASGYIYMGGAAFVRDSEFVYWFPYTGVPKTSFPLIDVFVGQEGTSGTGTWLHEDQKTPLTDEEYRRFILDRKRDLNDRNQKAQIDVLDAEFEAKTRKTKEVIDLNKANKRRNDQLPLGFPTRGRNAV